METGIFGTWTCAVGLRIETRLVLFISAGRYWVTPPQPCQTQVWPSAARLHHNCGDGGMQFSEKNSGFLRFDLNHGTGNPRKHRQLP